MITSEERLKKLTDGGAHALHRRRVKNADCGLVKGAEHAGSQRHTEVCHRRSGKTSGWTLRPEATQLVDHEHRKSRCYKRRNEIKEA